MQQAAAARVTRLRARGTAAFLLAACAFAAGACNGPEGAAGEDLLAGLVLVPTHGSEEDAFFMSATEITNAQFGEFLTATRYHGDDSEFLKHWRVAGGKGEPGGENQLLPLAVPRGLEDHPVVYVDYYDSSAYAEWRGMRLPTRGEWVHAATYSSDADYPWGIWQPGRANTLELGLGHLTPVGFFQNGVSALGLYDLQGNASEWCSSEAGPIVMGGSFRYYGRESRTSDQEQRPAPSTRHDDKGFRVVVPAASYLMRVCLTSTNSRDAKTSTLRRLLRKSAAARAVMEQLAARDREMKALLDDASSGLYR